MPTCDCCDRPFDKSALGQTTCTSCLISPKRSRMKDEEPMVEKNCVECQQPYMPTSNRQQICADCKAVKDVMEQPKITQEPPAFVPVQPCTPIPGNNVRVVEVLSPAKTIEELARDILRITGCKDLTLNYTDIILRITNNL